MAHTSLRFATRCLAGLSLLACAAGLKAQTVAEAVPVDTSGCVAVKHFLPRSQGRDKVRQLAGSVGYTHLMREGDDAWYAMFTVTPEYTQSFDGCKLARKLFGADICPCGKKNGVRIQGRGIASDPAFAGLTNPDECAGAAPRTGQGTAWIPNPFDPTKRDAKAWLADYFYLPQDFESTVCFDPSIRNFLVDLDLFVGLGGMCDSKCKGMYFRIHGPITHSRWDLNMCEDVVRKGVLDHPAGYFTPDVLERSFLLNSFSSFASGNAPGDGRIKQTWDSITAGGSNGPIITGSGAGSNVNDTNYRHFDTNFQPLQYARMATHDLKYTGFADLRFELGMDFVECADHHFGMNLQMAAPTGNRPDPCYLWAPIVGNGHFWELGAGMTGGWTFWRNEDETREVSFHYDINATHMFRDWRKYTFELKNRPNSAYMTVYQQHTENGGHVFAPLANISTLDVKIGIPVQVDAVAMLNMKLCGFSVDLGYNFWMRGCERTPMCGCDSGYPFGPGTSERGPLPGQWYLKGDAQVFAYGAVQAAYDGNPPTNSTYKHLVTPTRLVVSESRATIHDAPRGTGPIDPAVAGVPTVPVSAATTGLAGGTQVIANSGVDNPVLAQIAAANAFAQPGSCPTQHINTSTDAVYIGIDDLDFIRTRGLSHKIFGHLTYELDMCGIEVGSDCRPAIPFIGLGFFGEFGDNGSCNDRCTVRCNDSCIKTSLSQWGVWLKGGVSYK